MVALPLPVPHFRLGTIAEKIADLSARVYAFLKRNSCTLLALFGTMLWTVVTTASAVYSMHTSGPAHLCFSVSFGASCSLLTMAIGILFGGSRLLEE